MTRPLATVGNANVDLIMGPIAPWPAPGSESLCSHEDLRAGGAAGNVALAWSGLGVPFQIAANTGNDRFGDWLAEALAPHSRRWPRAATATTISVGITHPQGERSFFTTRGHLPKLSWSEVETMLDWQALAGGTLLLCGTFLTDALTQEYDKLFARADALRITVALDTGWPLEGWSPELRRQTMGWVARSGIVLFNEIEATSLTGLADPEAAARRLVQAMPQGALVVVKLGPNGALALADGHVCRAAAPKVVVKDTIGAGDVFNAALLAALADNQPLSAALTRAAATASLAVSTEPRRYKTLTEAAHEHP